jgi:hypothetical protein
MYDNAQIRHSPERKIYACLLNAATGNRPDFLQWSNDYE